MNNQPQNKVNVLESVNNLFEAIEKSHAKGMYSLEESAKIYTDVVVVKSFFQQLVDQQKKQTSKLQPIKEDSNEQ